ncbi:HWE histidine kinase domain-containing protein [Methylobacterium sp. OT2]|uniref:HWE histidine kinase domain-containing protein n=1 Tax=Methylobacterium sp. OT2 TaxID=2813779 RepID=UPI00197C2BD6|nr:HWE histidine kinase domain-containing protein [Methylobacterium sp. OT2]MBN4097961.1 PAS domain S-box protein [Methylobacterium sp. OT2]
MPKPALPSLLRDPVRLEALAATGILDTPPEAEFDDIAQLAALVCNTPVALVSLVAEDRQWFKAQVGFPLCETALNASVCAYTLAAPDLLTIPDLTVDPRTRDNPLVTGEPFIRFYAGAPLRDADGQVLGSLCVIDHEPRPGGLTDRQADALRRLARQVMTVMRERRLNAEMRTTRDALRTSQERLAFAFAASGSLGWWDWDIPANRLYAGEQFARMYGVDPKEAAKGAPLAAFVDGIHPDDRSWVGERIQNALDTGGEFSEEYRLLRADGTLTWVYARGRCFLDDDGRPLRYPGVAVDITARKLADAARAVGEARLKSIMETVPVGILLAEAPSGRILMGNQRLAEILGHDTLYAPSSDAYGAFVAFHEDGRRVEGHEYPLARITAGECKRAALEVLYQRPGGARCWIMITGEAVEDERGSTVGAVCAVSDIDDRKAAEASQDILNRELSHRLKNTLAMVQSIATQTLRNAASLPAAQEALAARLVVLGKAHDVLLLGHSETANVRDLVRGTLALHEDKAGRFHVSGPNLFIGPSAALMLGLVLHELATNATKYGALSTAAGRVDLDWSVTGDGEDAEFRLDWRERDGPPVAPPDRRGFGSRLIERGMGGGRVAIDYRVEGVSCVVNVPMESLQSRA